jgi:hypothetical protein
MRVAAAARLPPKGAMVVDVGCGLGESLLLWQRKFDVAASRYRLGWLETLLLIFTLDGMIQWMQER